MLRLSNRRRAAGAQEVVSAIGNAKRLRIGDVTGKAGARVSGALRRLDEDERVSLREVPTTVVRADINAERMARNDVRVASRLGYRVRGGERLHGSASAHGSRTNGRVA